jgi:hypothetical protein
VSRIAERLLEHHKTLWGHNSSTTSIMTEGAAEIRRLQEKVEILEAELRVTKELATGNFWRPAE